MNAVDRRPLVVLAEDSEDDAYFFRWSLQRAKLDCDLIELSSGSAALDYLTRVIASPVGPRPDLVFLDLQLPDSTGLDVLSSLDRCLTDSDMWVVVLSGSERPRDRTRALALGANEFYQKPLPAEKLKECFEAWQRRVSCV